MQVRVDAGEKSDTFRVKFHGLYGASGGKKVF